MKTTLFIGSVLNMSQWRYLHGVTHLSAGQWALKATTFMSRLHNAKRIPEKAQQLLTPEQISIDLHQRAGSQVARRIMTRNLTLKSKQPQMRRHQGTKHFKDDWNNLPLT